MIKYPRKDEKGHEKSYQEDLNTLSKNSAGRGFCPNFANVFAINLDEVAKDVCLARCGQSLASVDALFDSRAISMVTNKERRIYFIEFKNMKFSDLELQGTCAAPTQSLREDIPIKEELAHKAFDSILVAGIGPLRGEKIADFSTQSEFIVVYNDKTPKSSRYDDANKIDSDIGGMGHSGKDAYGIKIQWELNVLKSKGPYKSVHTWSIDEFNKIAPSFLR